MKPELKHEQVALILRVLSRVADVFVVYPSCAIGAFFIAVAMLGGAPITSVAEGLYAWADKAVRSVPSGTVLATECSTRRAKPGRPPVVCEVTDVRPIPAEKFVETTEDFIFGTYQALVLLSMTCLITVKGWREFLCLTDTKDREKTTTQKH